MHVQALYERQQCAQWESTFTIGLIVEAIVGTLGALECGLVAADYDRMKISPKMKISRKIVDRCIKNCDYEIFSRLGKGA